MTIATAIGVFLSMLFLLPALLVLSFVSADLLGFFRARRQTREEHRQAIQRRREFRLVKGGKRNA